VIVPELCPDDGLHAQLPEHVIAEPLCEVKSTCKYPVDDVYSLLKLIPVDGDPDSFAISTLSSSSYDDELHDDDEQRLMVTQS
jgi:hypothetical protein